MTAMHMKPNQMASQNAGVKSYMKLFDRAICPEDLLLLAKADYLGRLGPGMAREQMEASYAETEAVLQSMLAVYRDRMSRPYVMGRDLVEAGLTPGPQFREALEYAHKLRLAGLTKEEQMKQVLGQIRHLREVRNWEEIK